MSYSIDTYTQTHSHMFPYSGCFLHRELHLVLKDSRTLLMLVTTVFTILYEIFIFRSEARLHKLGDQLAISTSRTNANEEDSSFNNVSDGEPNDENAKSYINARESNPSLRKKKHRISHEVGKETKTGDLRKHLVGIYVPEKLTKVDMFAVYSDKNSKEANHADRTLAGSNGPRSVVHEENNNSQRKSTSHGTKHIKKVKCLEPAHDLPPTCMVAHAVDELIEVVEVENNEVMGATATGFERNTTKERRRFFISAATTSTSCKPRNCVQTVRG